MGIFAPGILWDPPEPLPPEYMYTQYQQHPGEPARGRTVPDLTIQGPTQNILPPWSISLHVSIIQDTASITATQTFWNNSENVIPHGAYTFPLPNGCTVTGFTCRIGTEKVLSGTVKSKQEAEELYKQHLTTGRASGFLEQNTPEVYTTTLGNIPPNTKIQVDLSFISLLKHRARVVEH